MLVGGDDTGGGKTVIVGGTTGASLTAVTVTVEVIVLEFNPLSFTVKLTVRAAVEGLSEEFAYVTARNAACHCSVVADPPAEVRLITPVAGL